MALLTNTASPDPLNSEDYDAIYFTGGHAVMWDFPDAEGLQRLTREIFERDGLDTQRGWSSPGESCELEPLHWRLPVRGKQG
ncbi:MAG: hypothetical protein R3292_04080 [Alcanivorax sp.]|nr:hypothetical protein [Alcanivorax sp.]